MNLPLSEVGDEHDIARPGAARKGELFAVAREVERINQIGLESSQLFRLAPIERLHPDVTDAIALIGVGEPATVRHPPDGPSALMLDVENSDRRAADKGQHSNFE